MYNDTFFQKHPLHIMMNTIKKTTLLLSALAVFYITGCTQPKASDILKNDAQKKELFSAIVSSDQASSELIDSLVTRRHEQVMMKMHTMMKTDPMMGKMMMGKMMEMCNDDSLMCKMMMNSMQSHSKVMKSMESMCNMNNMKGKSEAQKEEHLKHH